MPKGIRITNKKGVKKLGRQHQRRAVERKEAERQARPFSRF